MRKAAVHFLAHKKSDIFHAAMPKIKEIIWYCGIIFVFLPQNMRRYLHNKEKMLIFADKE